MNDFDISKELIESIESDNLVIFIGSGLSRSFDFPDWKGLVAEILKELSNENNSYEELIPVLYSGMFSEIEILDKILETDSQNKREVYKILVKLFEKDLTFENLDIQKKIGQLSGKIITTNYDKALEIALPGFKKIIPSNEFHIANINKHENFIFKVHGCIENPAECILFSIDYKNLYLENTAAIERLKSIISNKTILFIGFSFNDLYIRETFKYIHDVYKSYGNRHFILTTDEMVFRDYGLTTMKIESWDLLPKYIDHLITYKNKEINRDIPQQIIVANEENKTEIIKIALLFALPVDMEPFYNIDIILKAFRKYKITLGIYYLSEERLNEIEDYDYIFLFTKSIKNKILIEDEYFKSDLMSISQIEDHIHLNNLKGIFLFVDKDVKEPKHFNIPIAILKHDENMSNLLFKLFKRQDLRSVEYLQLFNEQKFKLTTIGKGSVISEKKLNHTKLSEKIERRNILSFIGRKTDITDIIRKTIDAQDKVITIKGSGGIGKTSIVKKVAIEFLERGFFSDGIYFLDCEFIKDYQTFERNIAKFFELENSINLVDHMKINQTIQDSIIILDNYEPLLYLDESMKMKELVSFISNYTTMIITSREWVDLEFEEKHELRAFTTEEALTLFEKNYSYKILEGEIKFLKEEILEKLLNNNPLAIKIVTKNLPKSTSMRALRDDLVQDFFRATDSGYKDIFDRSVDGNIERSKSLYQSIYYSYIRLNSKEQLVFEILSLFPNGIHMEFFKDFFNSEEFKRDIYRITNKEIKSLENKSLIEINGGFIKLQSIIGRFADFNLNNRTIVEKSKYFSRAFDFNRYIALLLNRIGNEQGKRISLEIFDKIEDNFIKSIEYLEYIEVEDDVLLSYILNLFNYSQRIGQAKKIRNKQNKLAELLDKFDDGKVFLDTILLYSKFYDGEFEDTFEKLTYKYPLDRTKDILNINNELIKSAVTINILNLYSMEGYELQILEITDSTADLEPEIYNILFKLGLYQDFKDIDNDIDFFHFEMQYNLKEINIVDLEDYLENGVYEKQFLEIIQINYIKTKMGLSEKKEIQKLVVSNPYTMGLKDLMLAMVEENIEKKIKLFEQGIGNLFHIKYYYVEGIYIYSKFLNEISSEHFSYWFSIGSKLAKKHNYQYLIYVFDKLINNIEFNYKEERPKNINIPLLVQEYNKEKNNIKKLLI